VISGVVLAAGTGSRFGATKQIVVVHGKPLAQHAIDALEAAGVDEVIVVTGHDAVKVASALTLPPEARIVYNAAFKDGQATSLAAAIHALDDESEAAVILMADQPGVEADVIRAMIDRFAVRLFGGHEHWRAGDDARLRHAGVLDRAGQVLFTESVSVGPVAAKATKEFRIKSAKGGVAGFRYKPLV